MIFVCRAILPDVWGLDRWLGGLGDRVFWLCPAWVHSVPGFGTARFERYGVVFLSRSGGDLLSHDLCRSTIGATALNFRVRDGIGCLARAMTTRPGKKHTHPARFARIQVELASDLFPGKVLLTLLFPDRIKPIEPLVPVN